jgi:hypothetical protein
MIPFPPGFSDDEDVDGDLDRTYPGPRRKPTPKQQKFQKSPRGKKSPRPYDSDDGAEQSPKSKKSRNSLYKSNSVIASSDEADDEDADPQPSNAKSVRNRMYSLNITQEDEEDVDSVIGNRNAGPSRPSNLGLGLGNTSDLEDEDSQHGSPAPSEQSNGFIRSRDLFSPDEDNGWNYDLRQNIDRTVKSTWMDQDQTADYDPTEENRKKMAELNKAKARKKKAKQGPAPKKKKIGKVKKFIVKLPFNAIGNVLQVTDEQDNWPDDWSELDSEEEAENREREQRQKLALQKPRFKPQEPIVDPKGEFNDLTGHPAARGCVFCRTIGLKCSMVEDGQWPCNGCSHEGHFCIPIIAPKVKGKCQRCGELGEEAICSFENPDQEQGDMCEQCLDAECENCIAGPAPGSSDRVDLDQILYGPDRKWVTCTNCRQDKKKRCSLKSKSEKPPCKGCKRHNIGCTFYEVSKTDPPKKGNKKVILPTTENEDTEKDGKGNFIPTVAGLGFFTAEDLADLEDSNNEEYTREETPELELSDAQGRTGIVTKIDTCFAHPIEYDILGDSTKNCSFCEMPLFGMVGHFERTVHVLKWHNNLGYGELAAGYQEEYGQTVICSACIMIRVQIINCAQPGHKMEPINTDTNVTDDHYEAMTALIEAQPGSDEYFYQLQKWCSMCFSLASFKCCNEQAALIDGEVTQGCGLRFCGNCETRFRKEFNEDSSIMATALDLEPKWKDEEDAEKQAHPARADVGFLIKDGHLMNNVANSFEADNIEDGVLVEGLEDGEGGKY